MIFASLRSWWRSLGCTQSWECIKANFMKPEKLSNFLLLIVDRTKSTRKTNTRLLVVLNNELQFISSLNKLINILKCDEHISFLKTLSLAEIQIIIQCKNVPADFLSHIENCKLHLCFQHKSVSHRSWFESNSMNVGIFVRNCPNLPAILICAWVYVPTCMQFLEI